MHSREPNLLYVLLIIMWDPKQILAKERSALINGNRVSHHLQIGIVCRLCSGEMRNVINPAHRANGVPDTNEMRFTFATKSLFKVRCHSEVYLFALEHPNRVRDQALVVFT